MNDILKKAEEYRKKVTKEASAHYLSAEYHRHQHMLLGAIATIITALVGTGIFAGLISQLGLEGKSPFTIPSGRAAWLYLVVVLLSIAAPILTVLHTFLHNAEDAAKHRISATGYDHVVERFDLFFLRYADVDSADKKAEALKEYEDILKENYMVRANSLPMPEIAYKKAEEKLRAEAVSSHKA